MRPEVGGTEEEEGTKRHEPPRRCDKLIADPFAYIRQEQENRQRAEHGRDQPFHPQPGAERKQDGPARIVFREAAALGVIHRIRGHELVQRMRPVVDGIFRIELTARK